MPFASPTVTVFEPLDEGYLVAFGAEPGALSETVKAIVALDPWQRRWIAQERAWWIADDAITRLARRLPALSDALAAWHRRPFDLDDYLASGIWSAQSSLRRRLALPPYVRAAYDRLGLTISATAEQVQTARRALARRHHPDAGGGHEAMAAINAAADTIVDWLVQRN
jgi:hypothetical protein